MKNSLNGYRLRKWQRTYTYRIKTFIARHVYFAGTKVSNFTKLALGLLGILSVLPLAAKRKEVGIFLITALSVTSVVWS